jgi:Putative prokaryotic signal transducing protein
MISAFGALQAPATNSRFTRPGPGARRSTLIGVAGEALPLIHAYNTAVHDIKLVVVQVFGSRAEAELAKGALEDAGIQSMLQADTAGGMREHLAWSGAGFRILVREDDAEEARDLLASLAKVGPEAGASWVS